MVHLVEAVANGEHSLNGLNGFHTKAKAFDSIEDTIASFARGEFVIVLDNPSRENEGDLIMAAEDMTAEKMAFMIRYTSGYVCAPVSEERAAALGLPLMVTENRDPLLTAYTITVDGLAPGLTTGISAHDRANTARMLADPNSTAASFRRPGHLVPLQARDGLVRVRNGHTEAAVELCRLAGKQPAAVICEMVKDTVAVPGRAELEGPGMMRRDDLLEFGRQWGLRVCTIEDLVTHVEAKDGKLS